MKTFISKIIAAAALLLFAVGSVHAQVNLPAAYGSVPLSLTGIGTVAGATTQTVTNQVMDVTRFQNVTLQAKFNFASSTTSNVVYQISRSIDRVNWESTPSITWTVAGNGTSVIVATKDIATAGVGYLRLESIQNTHATIVLTNLGFSYSVKRGAP